MYCKEQTFPVNANIKFGKFTMLFVVNMFWQSFPSLNIHHLLNSRAPLSVTKLQIFQIWSFLFFWESWKKNQLSSVENFIKRTGTSKFKRIRFIRIVCYVLYVSEYLSKIAFCRFLYKQMKFRCWLDSHSRLLPAEPWKNVPQIQIVTLH